MSATILGFGWRRQFSLPDRFQRVQAGFHPAGRSLAQTMSYGSCRRFLRRFEPPSWSEIKWSTSRQTPFLRDRP
jgi:hypothetical protein